MKRFFIFGKEVVYAEDHNREVEALKRDLDAKDRDYRLLKEQYEKQKKMIPARDKHGRYVKR